MRIPTSFNMMGAGGAEEVQPPLTFTAQQAGSTIKLEKWGNPYSVDMYTSTDGDNWTPYTIGATITLANIGDTVRFWNHNDKLSKNDDDYYSFSTTGAIAASGNANSMINYGELSAYCFYGLFWLCQSLTAAPALPATTLADSCYDSMFWECESLTAAPALPATTLADSCYSSMFSGCDSLTAAPALPATTLADSCYESMFWLCQSLTAAPALPATTLAKYCYDSMFSGCDSLTAAPALPATTMALSCYNGMFWGCTSLSNVEVAFTTFNVNYSTSYWFYEITQTTGTFRCPRALGTNETILRGESYCPSGWTVVNTD